MKSVIVTVTGKDGSPSLVMPRRCFEDLWAWIGLEPRRSGKISGEGMLDALFGVEACHLQSISAHPYLSALRSIADLAARSEESVSWA